MPKPQPIIGKLGKEPIETDARTLKLDTYIDREKLPPIPATYNWVAKKKSRWGMMQNLKLHDCTCAAAGHMIQCWTLNNGAQVIIADRHIVKAYCAITGYNPKTGKANKGASALKALRYWRNTGIGGYKIDAFASVNHKNRRHVTEALYLFGGMYVGLQLPMSIEGQKIWDMTPDGLDYNGRPGSYGGHAVCVVAYDDKGLTCISWGRKTKMTWAFWDAYVEEAYALLADSFLNDGKTPLGFDISLLKSDLMAIHH